LKNKCRESKTDKSDKELKGVDPFARTSLEKSVKSVAEKAKIKLAPKAKRNATFES